MSVATEAPSSDRTPGPNVDIVEPSGPTTERSPVYALSLVLALVALGLSVVIVVFDESALRGFEEDLLRFLHEQPDPFERFLLGLSQFVAFVYPIVLVGAFVLTRRARGLLVAAAAAGAGVLAIWTLQHALARTDAEPIVTPTGAWLLGDAFPNHSYLAAVAALAVVAGAYMGRRWGRVAWAFAGLVVLLRMLAGVELPVDLAMAIAAGWVCGDLALLAFGSPIHRSTGRDIASALGHSGYAVRRLVPASVDGRGSHPWEATTVDGRGLYVKVLGRDQRDADLLFRTYRFLRLKNVGDQRPFSSLRRSVEHEALLALKARDSGVRTPHLVTVATAAPDDLLLAYELLNGKPLDEITEDPSDELLSAIWQQVAIMRAQHIAHRDLRRANIVLDSSGEPWIIDFGVSELAASDDMLNQDVAQLLAATAIQVGPERAVAAAVEVLGDGATGRSLAYLQMPAFAGATRRTLREHKGLLDQLRSEVERVTGAEKIEYEPINRITPRTVLMLVSSLIALYVLIPQFADVSGMVEQLRDANWAFVFAAVLCSFVTYCGAAISLLGACPVPVSAVDALEVSLAGSFVNRITPAGVGGIGLNLRFMQKAGANTTEAASRWGVNAVVGGIVHLLLTVVFLLWAGQSGAFDFRLPEMPLLVALGVLLVGAGVVFLLPIGRRKLLGPATRVAKHAWTGVRDLARHPSRLGLMFAGSFLVTLPYLLGLYVAVRAFGGTTSFAAVGSVFLAGSVIGKAAPTPGGLGAVEAIFITALVGVGLDKEIAVPAVLLFRLTTFWLPILPGWLSFSHLSHEQAI